MFILVVVSCVLVKQILPFLMFDFVMKVTYLYLLLHIQFCEGKEPVKSEIMKAKGIVTMSVERLGMRYRLNVTLNNTI